VPAESQRRSRVGMKGMIPQTIAPTISGTKTALRAGNGQPAVSGISATCNTVTSG